MKILLSGFEAFAAEQQNPAWEAVKRLPGRLGTAELRRVKLPVSYERSWPALKAEIDEFSPDLVVCVGLAGGRAQICPEAVALNRDDSAVADNDGEVRGGTPIQQDGENAYISALPLHELAKNVRAEGIPAAVSYHAGTFVCNHLYYCLMCSLISEGKGRRGLFIHLPYSSEMLAQTGKLAPSLPLSTLVRGLTAALRTLIPDKEEVK